MSRTGHQTKQAFQCMHLPSRVVSSAGQKAAARESTVPMRCCLVTCRPWSARPSHPRELLRGTRKLPWKNKSPLLVNISPKLFVVPPHLTGVWYVGRECIQGCHLSPFCVSGISKVVWHKQKRSRKYLCLWRMSLTVLSILSCQTGTSLMSSNGTPGGHYQAISDDILCDIVWHPCAKSNGAKCGSVHWSLPHT